MRSIRAVFLFKNFLKKVIKGLRELRLGTNRSFPRGIGANFSLDVLVFGSREQFCMQSSKTPMEEIKYQTAFG